MTVKMEEEEATSQGVQANSRSWKRQRKQILPQSLSTRLLPPWTRFRHLTPRTVDNTIVLFLATKFMEICYYSNRKLIQKCFIFKGSRLPPS